MGNRWIKLPGHILFWPLPHPTSGAVLCTYL